MSILFSIASYTKAQSSQTVFTVDSRIGYSSNSYLNPFFAEWDPTLNSAYGMLAGFGQSTFFDSKNTAELTGGLILEPVFSNRDVWKGALGLVNYKRKISSKVSVGLQTGASYLSGTYERGSFWAQPQIVWFPTFFTSVTAKAGSNFRWYSNFSENDDSNTRFDLYGLEFETWSGYNWQIKANLYGSLDNVPNIQNQFSSSVSVGYVFLKGSSIRLKLGLEQYQFEVEETPGGPPIGGGGMVISSTEADRIFRLGVNASVPINQNFSVFASAEALRRNMTSTGESDMDMEVSGGFRISFQPPKTGRSGKISPEWETEEDGRMQVEVLYSGEGRLYLVGDFNDWNRAGLSMIEQEKNRHVTQLDLEQGAYEYKILLVEGETEEWLEFSTDVHTVDDRFGGKNGMIFVEYN